MAATTSTGILSRFEAQVQALLTRCSTSSLASAVKTPPPARGGSSASGFSVAREWGDNVQSPRRREHDPVGSVAQGPELH